MYMCSYYDWLYTAFTGEFSRPWSRRASQPQEWTINCFIITVLFLQLLSLLELVCPHPGCTAVLCNCATLRLILLFFSLDIGRTIKGYFQTGIDREIDFPSFFMNKLPVVFKYLSVKILLIGSVAEPEPHQELLAGINFRLRFICGNFFKNIPRTDESKVRKKIGIFFANSIADF